MRKLFYIDSRRNIKLMFCLLFLFIPIRYANSASYTLMSVGESLTVSQTTYMGGYISKVALAATLDAHLSFRDNGVGDAVITVNSYFNYETTVKLVFVERYQSYYSGRIHNLSHTYYKDVPIRCKYQAPDPSKKPKKVKLPERVRVPLGERVTVEPVLEPYGAVATSSSWDFHIRWAYCHTYQVENSINCQLVGMKLGYGEATITINGDEKLSASTIIEVIDPNNPPPDNIIIPDTIEVSVGKVSTISPIMVPEGTSTSLNWYSDNTSIATAEAGRITGKKEGETFVYYSSLYGLRDTCVVRVVNHNGMDDDTDVPYVMGLIEGHEYVDLGLDVLWASYNVGATSIIENGDSFAWSETEPKSDYSKSNYTGNKTSSDVTDISIQGTSQDAAYVQWGSAWCMPTTDQYTELLGKCSFGGEAVNTEGLVKANANNGASIYFPQKNRTYWTANSINDFNSLAEATYLPLNPNDEGYNRKHLERYKGYKVRAVSSVDPLTYGIKPTTISLSSPTKVKVTENFVLKYSITPSNATTPLRWYSENPLVASVSSVGVVEAVGVGTTKIWIETANGLKASCDVTVEDIPKVVQVVTNLMCSYFLDETGTLWGCGLNFFGILNDGSSSTSYLSPKIVMHDVIHASTGELYSGMTLLTKKDGSLWSAGQSSRGSLLDGNNKSRYYYEKVMDDVVLTAVLSSGASYILKKDGSLWAGASTKLADNVKSVVGSLKHNLVIKNDGTLWAMGENEDGQLGDGTTTSNGLVKIADDVVSAAAGWRHSLFVKKDGTLWGCGSNSSGQLGDGVGESTNTPVKIMDNVRSVSAGSSHTLVVKNDDTLWGFGNNGAGQLGNGATENISTPIKIMDNVVSAYAGSSQSFFIRKDGSLWGCGSNTRGKLGDGSGEDRTRPVKIVNGDVVDVSISVSPSSKTINVGDGFYCTYTISPANASSQTSVTWSSDDSSIASVSSSGYVSGKKAGTTYINATTANGKTARCKVTVETNNIKVTGISISTPTSMTVGGTQQLTATVSPSNATNKSVTWSSSNTSVATVSGAGLVTAKSAGTVTITCSASDGSGVKETCSITVSAASVNPTEPGILKMNVKQIALGYGHSLIVETDGTLWACGLNNAGQLGDGTTTDRKTPVKVMTDVATASAGHYYSMILKNDGTLWACGFNYFGNLGDGTNTSKKTPVKVVSDVAQVSAGYDYTMILKNDGTLWACGRNNYGQLGDGTTVDKKTPVKVMSSIVQVSSGYWHTLMQKTDWSLWACGENDYGQLGDGTTSDRETPVKVMDGVSQVSACGLHTMILKTDGTLWVCGNNSLGALGDGTTTNRTTPIKVMTDVAEMSAGFNHTMILKTDGTLWACGYNKYGQLGDGTTINRVTPVKVMTDVATASAGHYYSMILKRDGSLWACGYNKYGQLGDGTTTDRTSFVKIAEPSIIENEITVKTSNAGYATFYSAQSAYSLPRNLSAQVVTNASDNKLTYKTIADGSVSGVIPVGTPVMLVSDSKKSGTYTLTASNSTASYSGTNLLRGNDVATTTTGDGYHYKLSYGQPGSNLSNVFGWYWGAQNGAPFQIEGHKAWLVVPKSSSSTRGYAIGGEATGIEMVSGDDEVDAVYYDLQGRHVTKPTVKGVYIKNGKKVMVK